jgi:hypothetical protein
MTDGVDHEPRGFKTHHDVEDDFWFAMARTAKRTIEYWAYRIRRMAAPKERFR